MILTKYYLSREAEGFGLTKLQQPLCKQEGATSNKIVVLRDKNCGPKPSFSYLQEKRFFIL